MTTAKTPAADDTFWTVLLPTGVSLLWDGMKLPFVKLGKSLIETTEGVLVNPDQVVALIPPRNGPGAE